MPLTFKTAELIETIEKVQRTIIEVNEEFEANNKQALTEAREEWWGQHKEDVRALRDYLTRSIKNDTPPLTEDGKTLMKQERGWSSEGVKLFHGAGDSGVKRRVIAYQQPEALDGLLALLQAQQGENITDNQLKGLGYHPRDLATLFRATTVRVAAAAEAKE